MPDLITFTPDQLKSFPNFGMDDNWVKKLVKEFETPLQNVDGWISANDATKKKARELVAWFGKYTYNPKGNWQSPGGMWASKLLQVYFNNYISEDDFLTEAIIGRSNFFTEAFLELGDALALLNRVREKQSIKGKKSKNSDEMVTNFVRDMEMSKPYLEPDTREALTSRLSTLTLMRNIGMVASEYGTVMNRALNWKNDKTLSDDERESLFQRYNNAFRNKYRLPSPEYGITGDLVPFYFWVTREGNPCVQWDVKCIPLLPDVVYNFVNYLHGLVPQAELTSGETIVEKGSWIIEALPVGYCEKEGAALRHCGNKDAVTDKSQRIYSVRERVGYTKSDILARLTITAIPDERAILALKGESNKKPNSQILPKVLDVVTMLLKDPNRVQVIVGDSYVPEQDVNINDFTDEQLKSIYDTNPNLIHTQAHLGDPKYKPKKVSQRVLRGFKDTAHKLDTDRYKRIAGDEAQISEAYYNTPELYRLVLEGKVSRY